MQQVTYGPFEWPIADEDVRAALDQAYLDGSWGRYHGPNCEELAKELCQYFNSTYAMLCSSGTVGVELALRGLAVGSTDEVVVAGYDFPGNFRAIEAVGASPVLVDVDPTTWCLDTDKLEQIDTGSIKAIIVSHLHGGLADMPMILALAKERGWHARELRLQDAPPAVGAMSGC